MLLLAIFTANASDEIISGQKYVGKSLEIEGTLKYFRWNCSQNTSVLFVELVSDRSIEVRAVIKERIDFAAFKPNCKIRLNGRCISEPSASNPSFKRYSLEDVKYAILDGLPQEVVRGESSRFKNVVDSTPNIQSNLVRDRSSEENFQLSFDEKKVMKSIITVKGAKGSGSGFIAKVNGKKYLVTNIHVIFDNDAEFISTSNEKLELSSPLLSDDRDVALFELKNSQIPALELEPDISLLQENHPIVVYGNSLGGGVNTQLKGRIKSFVDAKNVEISAEIVPGNSGSPILNAKNGKVIGIATYGIVIKPSFSEGKLSFEDVKRFGMRLDTVKIEGFQAFDKRKYDNDVKVYNSLVSINELAKIILSDMYDSDRNLEPSKYDSKKYPSMSNVIRDWNDLVNKGRGKTTNTYESMLKRFRNQVSMPVSNAKAATINYTWIKSAVEKQIELNDSYCAIFDKIRKDIEAATR